MLHVRLICANKHYLLTFTLPAGVNAAADSQFTPPVSHIVGQRELAISNYRICKVCSTVSTDHATGTHIFPPIQPVLRPTDGQTDRQTDRQQTMSMTAKRSVFPIIARLESSVSSAQSLSTSTPLSVNNDDAAAAAATAMTRSNDWNTWSPHLLSLLRKPRSDMREIMLCATT